MPRGKVTGQRAEFLLLNNKLGCCLFRERQTTPAQIEAALTLEVTSARNPHRLLQNVSKTTEAGETLCANIDEGQTVGPFFFKRCIISVNVSGGI